MKISIIIPIYNEVELLPAVLERVRDVNRWCQLHGIRPRWLFMVGLPTETKEEALGTLDLIAELDGESSLGVLKVYPWTPLEHLAKERGVLPGDFSWTRAAGRGELRPALRGGRAAKEIRLPHTLLPQRGRLLRQRRPGTHPTASIQQSRARHTDDA